MCCNVNVATYLISLGVDVNKPDAQGTTPLQLCDFYGISRLCDLLIEHGADASSMRKPLSCVYHTMLGDMTYRAYECRKKAKHCDYPDCVNEGNNSKPLHACSSCRAVYYCCREHQEAHWKEHKNLCQAIKKKLHSS